MAPPSGTRLLIESHPKVAPLWVAVKLHEPTVLSNPKTFATPSPDKLNERPGFSSMKEIDVRSNDEAGEPLVVAQSGFETDRGEYVKLL